MKKHIIQFSSLLTLLLFVAGFMILSSCEKDITVGIPQADKKPVVEGYIFQGEYATVGITWSFPFFKPLTGVDFTDPAAAQEFLVLDALVTLSDGFSSETLSLTFDPTSFPPIYYQGDSILGQPGRTYTLNIKFPGYDLAAVTTIPEPVSLDSLAFKVEAGEDSLGFARMYFQDPPAIGNIYRLYSKRPSYSNYVPTYAVGNSVIDDQAYNGQYIEFLFGRPDERNNVFVSDTDTAEVYGDDSGYWKLGDTIMVRFCTIDRISYDFIKTMENAAGTSGNPFTNPTTVKSNITGGNALGGFCGLSVSEIQRIAQ
jgi:hypothetical protein